MKMYGHGPLSMFNVRRLIEPVIFGMLSVEPEIFIRPQSMVKVLIFPIHLKWRNLTFMYFGRIIQYLLVYVVSSSYAGHDLPLKIIKKRKYEFLRIAAGIIPHGVLSKWYSSHNHGSIGVSVELFMWPLKRVGYLDRKNELMKNNRELRAHKVHTKVNGSHSEMLRWYELQCNFIVSKI